MRTLSHSIALSFLAAAAWLSASIAPGDPEWPEVYPEWWYNADDPANGVIDATQPVLNENNEAPIAIGQLKHIASEARDELDVMLAPIGGAGSEIDTLVDSFTTISPSNLSPANIGQLKNVSAKFFDRFAEVGFTPNDTGWPDSLILNQGEMDNSPLYPWLNDVTTDNASLASIGQAKHLFSWQVRDYVALDSDSDELPDFIEQLIIDSDPDDEIASLEDIMPDSDFDDDTIGIWDELLQGSDPFANTDLNENSLPDDWELFWNDQFAVFPKPITASLTHQESITKQLYLNNPVSPDANFTVTVGDNLAGNEVVYTYEDSLTGGATYNWTEISATGTLLSEVSNADDDFEGITLTQFSFPFYGVNHTEIFVNSNGLITFESGSSSYSNRSIPSTSSPDNFIAPFWLDQNASDAGDIYYQEESDRLIIQFDGIAEYGGSGRFTYQAVLHSNGGIEFLYKDMSAEASVISAATVGIENSDGTYGLEIAYDESYLQSGLAVQILESLPYFVKVSPQGGTAYLTSIFSLDVTFSTFDLLPGIYTANIHIAHTGTGFTPWNIPAILEITNPPATIELYEPTDGEIYWEDERINFSARAYDTDFGIDRVEFYASQIRRDQDTEGDENEFEGFWSSPGIGQHTVIARIVDSLGETTDSESVMIRVLADSDLDRMDDTWEQQYFGTLNEEASADFDGDGIPNIFEYNHGTDPADAQSKLIFTETQTGAFDYFLVDNELVTETEFKKKTISAAINSANNFDVIEVRPGTYNEVLGILHKRLYVFGSAGARNTIIDASGFNERILDLRSESVFAGLTFQNVHVESSDYNGGAVYTYIPFYQNKPRFIGCRFINNAVNGLGGAIYVGTGDIMFVSCTIAGNRGMYGNAIHNSFVHNDVTLINTLLWNPGTSAEITGERDSVIFDHSLTRDDNTGTVVIDGIDQFVTEPGLAYGYSLQSTSVARDSGTLSLYANPDFDGELFVDGLKDIGADEFNDTDGDGLPNWIEALTGSDLSVEADYDGDFLTNLDDYNAGADPLSGDTDFDGILDGDELYGDGTYGDTDGYVTEVNNPDTDGDTLDDGWEIDYGSNPTDTDTDNDGLDDGKEFLLDSNPLSSDTDEDAMPDLFEYENDLDILNDDSEFDLDKDGLSNYEEYLEGTRVDYFDSDDDLLSDGWEVGSGMDPLVFDNINDDEDGDGINTFDEYQYGTSPIQIDTDGDGVSDSVEINQGSNPTNSGDGGQAPPEDNIQEVSFSVGDHSGSQSERWEMLIDGLGPDTRRIKFSNPDFGTVGENTFKLWKDSSYRITLSHIGSNLETPDYDWTATVEDNASLSDSFGVIHRIWIIDNQDDLLGQFDPSSTNTAKDKEAFLRKLDLISPAGNIDNDPVNKPIDGSDGTGTVPDGANEFTFSTASSGVLTIQFKAELVGSDAATLDQVKDRVKFTIENVGQAPVWDAANPGGVSSVSGSFLVAKSTFTGLPSTNSDFGNKKVQLLFDGNVVEEPEIEVFFPKNSKNHPGSNKGVTPNWLYYWKNGNGDVCGIPSDAIYDGSNPNLYGYVLPGVDRKLRLGPLAPTTNSGPETYTSPVIKPGTNPPVTYGSLTVTGQGEGIACVAETVEHELYHLTIYDDAKGKVDADSDGVANSSEGNLTNVDSDINDGDTYRMQNTFGSTYISYGDNEIRCRKKELSVSFPIYPDRDWANPGCQHKNQFGPSP